MTQGKRVVKFLLPITNFRPNPNPYAYPYALALILMPSNQFHLLSFGSFLRWWTFLMANLWDGWRTCHLTPGTVRARVAIWPHRLSFHNAVFRAQQHLHIFFFWGGGAQSLQGPQMSGNCFEMFFLNRR